MGQKLTYGSKKRREKRRLKEKENRKKTILKAALELFVERGYRQTKMDMVAERSGLSKGLLYFYFSSKDQILTEIVKENFGDLFLSLREAIKDESDPVRQLEKFILTEVRFYIGKRPLSRLLYSLLVGYELEGIREDYRQVFLDFHKKERDVLSEILKKGVKEGRFREKEASLLLFFVSGPLQSLIFFRRKPLTDPEETARDLFTLMLHGLLNK